MLCTSPSPFGNLQRTATKPNSSLSTFLLPLLQLGACQSEWKYFPSLQVFTDGSSIYALLCAFLLLSHIILLNSLRELILNEAFKPTEQAESGEKIPTLFLRDDPRHRADANWQLSHQEKTNPKPSSCQGTKCWMLDREKWMHSLQFKLGSEAADTQLPQVLKLKWKLLFTGCEW